MVTPCDTLPVQVEPVRFELFFDTAVSEIRLDDDDAASCSGSSTPTTLLRKLLAGQLSLDSPHGCHEHARATRAAHFQVSDFECAAHGLL